MSFIAFSTAAPQVGEEQPLSSTARLVSSWTTLDISAAFPVGKTPHSVSALIVLGTDLPGSGLLGNLRVRKLGSTTSFEEAPGALGITSIIRRDSGEYQSGGFTAVVTIPVDTNGKFEYQLQNDSDAPRTMIRLLEVTTTEIIDPLLSAERGAANGVASLNGSTLVVENPANATATPTAGKIPKADGAGKLNGWVDIPSVPPAFEVIDTLTVEASHTGDTLETTLHTAVIPANEMGANGIVRLFALFRSMGAGQHLYWVKFAGIAVRASNFTANNLMVDVPATFIWNKNATNAQGSGILSGIHHLRTSEAPFSSAIDTTAAVDITFTVRNLTAGDTSYLRLVVVEVLHQD